MRIFYHFPFEPGAVSGRTVHVQQFIRSIEELGDCIVTRNPDSARADPGYPPDRLGRLRLLRQVNVIYERLEYRAPSGGWYRWPHRLLLRRPIVAWELNTVPEFGATAGLDETQVKFEKAMFRRLASRCDVAFCVSEELRRYAIEELGLAHVVTVPNGSDPVRFSPNVESAAPIAPLLPEVNVVWIGSANVDWHDFDLLRRTADRVARVATGLQVHFHLLGHGLPASGSVPTNFHYHGAVPYEDLPQWLARCQIGLIAYRPGPAHYSSPLKLFDYLASGLAVVSTEQPQVRELMAQLGGEDLIVPSGDDRAFAEVLLRLVAEPARRAALGAAGRRLVESRYTWRHNALKIRDELQAMLDARSGVRRRSP